MKRSNLQSFGTIPNSDIVSEDAQWRGRRLIRSSIHSVVRCGVSIQKKSLVMCFPKNLLLLKSTINGQREMLCKLSPEVYKNLCSFSHIEAEMIVFKSLDKLAHLVPVVDFILPDACSFKTFNWSLFWHIPLKMTARHPEKWLYYRQVSFEPLKIKKRIIWKL